MCSVCQTSGESVTTMIDFPAGPRGKIEVSQMRSGCMTRRCWCPAPGWPDAARSRLAPSLGSSRGLSRAA